MPRKKPKRTTKDRGRRHRNLMAQKSREQSREAAEIGAIPEVENPKRRAACERDLMKFLTAYFPNTTGLKPFSEDHHEVVARLEHCALYGGRFTNAVYRGFAKTTISENSAIWAVSYGHRSYVPLLAADKELADDIIDSIKLELETNDLLFADFPEICFPIRALEGRPQRCATQTCGGKPTRIEWQADRIVLPTIEGSKASATILRTKGLHGNIRGLKFKRPDGVQMRPDMIVIDDPQSDELAGSEDQVKKLVSKIKKSVLQSAGHNKKLAVIMNATVIAGDDVVEQFLDHTRNPSWQGVRIKMVKQWADLHKEEWLGPYATIRNDYDDDLPGDQARAQKDATAYYRKRRKKMDAGCIVSWKHCYDPETEISAIQHAYNILIDEGEDVFASEMQNQPLSNDEADDEQVTVAQILQKTNNHSRWLVPKSSSFLTAFIDVQKKLLYYVVAGWTVDFSGAIVDYDTWPEQKQQHFRLRDVKYSYTIVARKDGIKAGWEGCLYYALDQLTDKLLGREWARDAAGTMHIDRCLIDANWGLSTDVVYEFCRQSKYSARLIPSHGHAVDVNSKPMAQWPRKPGDRFGQNWTIPGSRGRRPVRHVLFDANYWKSFTMARLATAMGDVGCLTLFGDSETAARHQMLAEHFTAAKRKRIVGKKREIDIWKLPDRKPDNHLDDGLIGCAVGAAIEGAVLPAIGGRKPRKSSGPYKTMAERRAEKRKRSRAHG